MTSALPPATSPDALAEPSVLSRALECAADLAGHPVSASAALQAVLDTGIDDSALESAGAAARALGLEAIVPAVGQPHLVIGHPMLVPHADGAWLVVFTRNGRRVSVTRIDGLGDTRVVLRRSKFVAEYSGIEGLHLQSQQCLERIGTAGAAEESPGPWQRLRGYLSLDRRDLIVVAVYAVVIGGLTLATPIAVQALVNTVAFGAVLQPLVVLSLLLFGGISFAGMLRLLESYVVEVLQRRVFVRIADDFGRRFPSLHADVFDKKVGPELVNRFFEVLTIQKSLSTLLLDGLGVALQTGIGMLVLGFYHPILLAFDVVLVGLLLFVIALGRGAVDAGLEESSAKYRAAAWLEDISRAPQLFRGISGRRRAASRTDALSRDYLRARKSHFRILLRQVAGGVGLQIISTVALLSVGGWLVIERQLTLGELVAAELIITAIAAGFTKLGKNLEKLYDLNVGVQKLAKVVDLPLERQGGQRLEAGGPASISVRGVAAARGSSAVFSDVSFDVGTGEKVLLSASPGAGTSTLLELIGGHRSAVAGQIHIDDTDVRRADLPTWRDRVTLVEGAEFVAGTILDNLRLLAPDTVNDRTAREALRWVGLCDAVDDLPEGLDTELLPRGRPLASSHARRLALARAVVARPRVLLLDRALDGLRLSDSGMESLLDVIFAEDAPWTAVIVSDDPRVMARCGRSVELGVSMLEEDR